MKQIRLIAMILLLATACIGAGPPQDAYEAALNAVPAASSLRAFHDLLCAEPHPAGTDADQRMIQLLLGEFRRMGIPAQREDFWAYLARPVDAGLWIVSPTERGPGARTLDLLAGPRALPLQERRLMEDPDTADEHRGIGWNAYSGNGTAVGEVVYANYGTREDFRKLRELGVSCEGRIVIARYGGNFRGFKAKFAQEAGAAGLIIYTDPADAGYKRGIAYPDGGWANETSIQRGSIITLPYPGDPLTPGEPADKGADRLDPATVALPVIPVQPVGWQAAREIMSLMTGPAVPAGWQGGLPLAYRLTGGASLEVKLTVLQRRQILPSANVIGVIPGAVWPEQQVIIGCHFDAWTFGAGDPHAGSIVLLEMARSFATAAAAGHRPARTVVFAHWGAEEFGVIGSTEWCEAHREELAERAVAYLNLDMAAMGPNFRASAAPVLQTVIADAARGVPQAGGTDEQTIFDAWVSEPDAGPSFGSLGGGSDHIGFYCHLGIPSAGFGAGGAPGTAYHSAYDTLTWYRQVVGDDYGPALMLSRIGNLVAARLANAPLLPLDPSRYATDAGRHLDALRRRADEKKLLVVDGALRATIDRFGRSAGAAMEQVRSALESGRLDDGALEQVNGILLTLERCWLVEEGLPDRPWFRSLYAASDPDSGYSAWMLPGLRHAIERGDQAALDAALWRYAEVFRLLTERMEEIEGVVKRTEGS